MRLRGPVMDVTVARAAASGASSSRTARAESFGDALQRRLVGRAEERARNVARDPTRELAPRGEPWLSRLPELAGEPDRRPLATGAIQRVAVALEVLRAGERSRVEIGLQGGAALQLVAARDGVTLTVTVASPHARTAAAELPALLEALRRSGVAIARAEVRVRQERRRGSGRSR